MELKFNTHHFGSEKDDFFIYFYKIFKKFEHLDDVNYAHIINIQKTMDLNQITIQHHFEKYNYSYIDVISYAKRKYDYRSIATYVKTLKNKLK